MWCLGQSLVLLESLLVDLEGGLDVVQQMHAELQHIILTVQVRRGAAGRGVGRGHVLLCVSCVMCHVSCVVCHVSCAHAGCWMQETVGGSTAVSLKF